MRKALIAATLVLLASQARADADGDLDRIPAAASAPVQIQAATTDALYVEAEANAAARRGRLAVPSTSQPPPQWGVRLFLDMRLRRDLGSGLSLVYSGRLNLRAEDGLTFPSHESVRNDWRELYLDWHPRAGLFVEAGRINLKNGVALGYNPTDFFKTRAVVEPTSADPSVLREDRIGTAMATGQYLWPGGSVFLAVAPKLARASPLYDDAHLPSFDPMFDRTNSETRLLAKASLNLFTGFSPEFLIYHAGDDTRFGANLTWGLGRALVLYAEWAGGRRAGLVARGWSEGIRTGLLPAGSIAPIPADTRRRFRNDVAAGLTYTFDFGPTLALEYQLHEGSLSRADWQAWFAAGQTGSPATRGALWYLRGYANARQEPMTRQAIFASLDWRDAFRRNLHLSAFSQIDAQDGSAFFEAEAEYYLSGAWTLGGVVSATTGGQRSQFGSLPKAATAMIRLRHYL